MTTTRISLATTWRNAESIVLLSRPSVPPPRAPARGRFPDPYADSINALHVLVDSTSESTDVPDDKGWMYDDRMVGEVISGMRRGGRDGVRGGRFEVHAGDQLVT